MYFDRRLFGMTRGVRGRIALATLVAPALFHRANERASLARRRDYAALGSDFLDSLQGLPTLKVFGQSRQRGALLAERARRGCRTARSARARC